MFLFGPGPLCPVGGSTSLSVLIASERSTGLRSSLCTLEPKGKGAETLELDRHLEVFSIKHGALAGASALVAAWRSGAFSASDPRFWDLAQRVHGEAAGSGALIAVLLFHRAIALQGVI